MTHASPSAQPLQPRPLIRLVGRFHAARPDGIVQAPSSRRIGELLTYLLLMRADNAPRETLSALLYPQSDDERAAAALRQVFSAAQRWIREELGLEQLLNSDRQMVSLQRDAVQVDVLSVEAAVTTVTRHRHRSLRSCRACRQTLSDALALLDDEDLPLMPDQPSPFERWYHERLRDFLTLCAVGFEELFDVTLSEAPHEALKLASRWSRLDPFNETAQRAVWLSLYRLGRRVDALRAAAQFSAELARRFAVEPDSETRRLIEQMRSGSLPESHRLPLTPPADVFGRDGERQALLRLLEDGTQRLITIVGIGGVGKTTLARLVGAELDTHFADGVLLVELSSCRSAAELLSAIATALNLRIGPSGDPAAAVTAALRMLDTLLILDNVEQINDAAEAVNLLLTQTTRSVLIASRRPLNLSREHLIELHGLSETAADDGRLSPALKLLQHALLRNAVPISPDELLQHGPALIHACNGLPLAIELAAAQARFRPLADIVAAIRQEPEQLTGADGSRPERQRSLQAVIEQTLLLLPEDERLMLAVMTQFVGPFDLHRLQLVARQIAPETRVQQAWRSAINVSLLQRAEHHRFRMHDLIRRLIGRCRPLTADEQRVVNDSYVAAFLAPIAADGIAFINERTLAWIEQHRYELPDIRRAWQLADVTRDADLLRRAALPLSVIAIGAGWINEYDELLRLTIARLPAAADGALLRRLHGIRILLSLHHLENARVADSLELLLREPLPQPLQPEHAVALRQRALQLLQQQRPAEAFVDIERSRDMVEHHEMPMVKPEPVALLYYYYRAAGDPEQAAHYLHAILEVAQRLGDRRGELAARNGLALIPAGNGDVAAALPLFQQAIAVARAIGDEGALPTLLANSARARNMLNGPHADSDAELHEAITIARRYGMSYSLRTALGASLTALPADATPSAQIAILHEILSIDCTIGLRSDSIDYGLLLVDALRNDGQAEAAAAVAETLAQQPVCSDEQRQQLHERQLSSLTPAPSPAHDATPRDGLRSVLERMRSPRG